MNTKEERHHRIINIIQHQRISRQEELLEQLLSLGFSLTQATLSRDLKELKVGKTPDSEFGNIYFISSTTNSNHKLHGVNSIEYVRDMVLIKCNGGYAGSVAASIDEIDMHEIAGTIAGNDTILVILKDQISYNQFRHTLIKHFDGIGYLFSETSIKTI
jgi:transcriptional regulator of arginine metabolism